MIVHMRKLDNSVFVDVVYSIKDLVIFDIICQTLNSYLPQTSFLLPMQTEHCEKYT